MNSEKIIIILSESTDYSTNAVMDWIRKMNFKVIRINDNDSLTIKNLSIDSKVHFEIVLQQFATKEKMEFKSTDIHSIWYRRGALNFHRNIVKHLNLEDWKKQELQLEFDNQVTHLSRFLNLWMYDDHDVYVIGNELDNRTNKMYNLLLARQLGIETPVSFMTSEKKVIEDYILRRKTNLITKPVSQGSALGYKSRINGFTSRISELELSEIPDFFPMSFFQEKVDKLFEIRTFYLNEKTYSMAIFSQGDPQTEIDFRNYNDEKPNRTPPYTLPPELNEKIIRFMKISKLRSGSLDFVVDQQGRHLFLEVNPIGQYYQVTYPCNYMIENEIAQALIQQL